jgi:hypothetical protein
MVMLAKIQNDVLNSEYIMINYFIDLTTNYTCGYEVYSAIISQNTTVLKAGEEIEIFGGMGFFTCAANPKFTIDGQIFKSDEYGTAVYKLKIKQPPGRYSIPVKVEFTKADGTQDVMIKNIKYQVLQ